MFVPAYIQFNAVQITPEEGWLHIIGDSYTDTRDTHDCVLLEYTGLKDKNGKEIYEGDVMQNEDGVGRSVAEWDHCGFNRRWIPIGVTSPLSLNTEQWEVIGNIYENPELLNKDN